MADIEAPGCPVCGGGLEVRVEDLYCAGCDLSYEKGTP
jgi:hypothetical protein